MVQNHSPLFFALCHCLWLFAVISEPVCRVQNTTKCNLCLLAGYLNVLVNSQWKSRWCQIKDGHLHFYQDKNRSKLAQQPLSLAGCEVIPEPSPDHLYSFRILHNGEERVVLEVRCTSLYMFCFSLGVIAGLKPVSAS